MYGKKFDRTWKMFEEIDREAEFWQMINEGSNDFLEGMIIC